MTRPLTCALTITALLALAAPFAWAGGAPSSGLKKGKPVTCKKNQDIVIKGRHIKTDGEAVNVVGNCDVLIVKSLIEAGGVAVKIKGNGDVRIRQSTIRGAKGAVSVSGNGDIYLKGSKFCGRVSIKGNADKHDEGGNTFLKKCAAPAKAAASKTDKVLPPDLRPHKPVRCTGTGKVVIKDRLIKTDGHGVQVIGSCEVVIQGSRIEAGGHGILVTGSGKVVVTDSIIKGAKGAAKLVGSSQMTVSGSTFQGKIIKVGTTRLVDKGGNTFSK